MANNLTGADPVIGDVANSGVELSSSYPVKMGGRAVSVDGTDPGTVSEDDRTHANFNLSGGQIVDIGHPYYFHTTVSFTTATTGSVFLTAPTGLRPFVTDIVASSDTAGAMSLINPNTSSSIVLANMRVQASGGMWSHSFRIPLTASEKVTTTAAVTLALTTAQTITAFNICGFYAP